MTTQGLNLFIVDDNPLVVTGLRNYLNQRFGTNITISTFTTGASALEQIDKNTGIVILDYYLENENGNDVLKSIKKINPKTEVIMLSSNEDIGVAIESFRNGATDYVVKGAKAWDKVISDVYKIITFPVRFIAKELKISKFLAMILLSFVFVAAGSFLFYYFY